MATLAPGAVFAGHRIEEVAGRGGMGIVYRATHLALDHVVALKVISPELAADEVFRERFRSESRIAASIRHPNVVPIHHAGEEEGLLFVTMDFIEGTDLRGLLNEKGRLDPYEAVSIVSDVAAALDAAHARGLVHRDVKPGNVLLERQDGGQHVYLTDFGLTKLVGSTSGVTATGAFVGTLDYVAPEQIKGGVIDARADIYALGCVLYELLLGHAPFSSREDKVAKIYAHLQDEPPSLVIARPELSPAFEEVVLRAMAKEPDDRQPSAGDLARAAQAALRGARMTGVEHSVAVGAAAPSGTHEVPAGVATVASESAKPSEEATKATTQPEAEAPEAEAHEADAETRPVEAPPEGEPAPPAPAPKPKKERRSPLPVVLGLAAVGLIGVAIAVALGGGGGGDGAADSGGKDKQKAAGSGEKEFDSEDVGKPVQLGGAPIGVAVVDDLALGIDRLLVANRDAQELDVLSNDGKGFQTLPVGATPQAVDAGDENIWVVNTDANSVSQIRTETLAPKGEIPVGASPTDVAVGNRAIWVTSQDGTVSRILPSSGAVVATVQTGGEPQGVAAVQTGTQVWFSDRAGGSIRKIEPDTNAASLEVEVGRDPKGLAIDSTGAPWVAVTSAGQLVRVNPEGKGSVATKILVGSEPRDIAIGFDSVWVTCGDGTVWRVDVNTGKVLSKTDVGGSPEGIDISESTRTVWVALGDKGELVPIKPSAG